MKRYVVIEKQVGETPLMAVEAWKGAHPEFRDITACYAGRLDPMASGKLLVLLGDECKRQKAYHGLDKEYQIEVVLDIGTDTGDVLGMPTLARTETRASETKLRSVLASLDGSASVPYPVYSSKTVDGKPLFQYALEGMLATISIPTHTETIHSISLQGSTLVTTEALRARVEELLSKAPRDASESKALGADFRQNAIRASWDTLFASDQDRQFATTRLRVVCASGTYMRTLAERIGEALGTSGFAISIHRTRIGTFQKLGSFGFWSKTYR